MPRTDLTTAAEIYTTASHYRIAPQSLAGLLVTWARDNPAILTPFFRLHKRRARKLKVLGFDEPEWGVVVPLRSDLLKWLAEVAGGFIGMTAVWDAWKTHNKTAWRPADGEIKKRLAMRAKRR